MSGRSIYRDILQGVAWNRAVKPVILARNTVRYVHEDGTTRYRLHDTDILTVSLDGVIDVTPNGWHTLTTRDRIQRGLQDILGKGVSVNSVYGGRCTAVDGVIFQSSVTLRAGRAVQTAGTTAEAESAKLEMITEQAAKRKESRERTKQRKVNALRVRFGKEFYDGYTAAYATRRSRKQGVQS